MGKFWIKEKNKIILLVVVIFSLFLRFYRVSELFVFTGDEEHQLTISQTIVDNFHLEWVGVSSADTGFYLGPFWQYFGAFWLVLSRGDPLITAYVAAGIGVLTTILVYLVGKTLFSKNVGLIASFLYATLPLLIYYDRKFWNPALTAFISLTLLFSLYKTKNSSWWWVAVAGFYGLAFHVHLSLLPLGLIIIYKVIKSRNRVRFKNLIIPCLLFLAILSPLIGFDLLHNFSNLKTPIRIFTSVSDNPSKFDLKRNFSQFYRLMGRLWFLYPSRSNSDEVLHDCSPYFNNKDFHQKGLTTTFSDNIPVLSFFSIFLLAWFLFDKYTWAKPATRLLGLFLMIIIVSYLLLPNTPLEYYLLGVFPLFLFIPGLLYTKLENSKARRFYLAVFILLPFLSVNTVLKATAEYGLSAKRQLIDGVMNVVGDTPYELQAAGLCHKYEGWRFLFKAYGKPPAKSYTDPMFGWLYKDEITGVKVKYKVILSETRIQYNPPPNIFATITSDGFKAYIYKNY